MYRQRNFGDELSIPWLHREHHVNATPHARLTEKYEENVETGHSRLRLVE
jgi:hypothetical protein